MAKRIPITIDATLQHVDSTTTLSDLVPEGTKSVVTGAGKIIPASNFGQYRALDVPEGFDTMAATINKAGRYDGLLEREVNLIDHWLGGFEPCPTGDRYSFIGDNGDFVAVANFPLPDAYRPDYINLALYVDQYPTVAPIGIYLARKPECAWHISQIRSKLNVFSDDAYHGAEKPLAGFEWVCLVPDGWRINDVDIRKGQNLQKYLAYFYGLLAE